MDFGWQKTDKTIDDIEYDHKQTEPTLNPQ